MGNTQNKPRYQRNWRWFVSAPFYRLSYNELAHQLDEELRAFLGGGLAGAVVADCGCGPGVVVEKFLQWGAARVFAIDDNPGMVQQVRAHLAQAIAAGRLVVVPCAFTPQLFPDLQAQYLGGRGFDVILFKRSLYLPPQRALPVLRSAVTALEPGGVLLVVHPEVSLGRYAFARGGRWASHTLYHLFNRTISLLGCWLRLGAYQLYTRDALAALLEAAAPGLPMIPVPTQQQAFNLLAVRRPPQAPA